MDFKVTEPNANYIASEYMLEFLFCITNFFFEDLITLELVSIRCERNNENVHFSIISFTADQR